MWPFRLFVTNLFFLQEILSLTNVEWMTSTTLRESVINFMRIREFNVHNFNDRNGYTMSINTEHSSAKATFLCGFLLLPLGFIH